LLFLQFAIRISLTLEAISHALAQCGASNDHIFILIEPASELFHEQELHGADACRHPDHIDQDEQYADTQLIEISSLVIDAVALFRGAVRLLAARVRAIHATFIAKLVWEEEATLVHPIFLSGLYRVFAERFISPVPVIRHARNFIIYRL